MPSVVVDSVLVEAGWDPTALEQGIARSERLVKEFTSRTGGLKVGLQVDDAGLKQFLTGITQQALPPLTIDTTQLRTNLAAAGTSVQEFFAGFKGGEVVGVVGLLRAIQDELAAIGQTGFLELAIQEAKVMQVELGTTSTEAKKLQAVIDTLSTTTTIGLDVQPALTASTSLIASLGLATRTAVDLQGVLNQPIGVPPIPPTGLREIIGQQEQVAATAEQAAHAEAVLGQALAEAGAQSITLSAGIRQAVTFNEQLAIAARQAADGLTAQARAAAAAAQVNAAAQAAGAGPGAGAALGAVAGANVLAAAENRAAVEGGHMAEGIALAARQTTILAAAEAAAATGTGRLNANFAECAIQARALAAASGAAVPNIDRLGAGAPKIDTLGHGARQTALHFVTLTAASVGADSAVSRLAANLLGLTTGFGAISIGAIAIFAAAKAWEFFTDGARRAKEETQKALDTLLRLQEAQRDPVRVKLEVTGDVIRRMEEVRAEIVKLAAEQRNLEAHPLVFSDRGGDQTAARLVFIQGRLVELGREFNTLGSAVAAGGLDLAAEQARQLAEALRLGTAGATGLTEAVTALHALNAEIASGAGDRARLNELQQRSNDILGAALDPIQQQLDALRGLREAQRSLGTSRIRLETDEASDRLADLRRQLAELASTLSPTQRPLVLRLQVAVDEEELQQEMAPIQLRVQLDQPLAQAAVQQIQLLRSQIQSLDAPVGVRLDLADAQAGLSQFQAALASDIEAIGRLGPTAQRALASTAQALRALQQQLRDTATQSPLTTLVSSVGPLVERLTVLRGRFDDVSQAERAGAGVTVELASRYAALAAAIARAGGPLEADTRLLQAQAQILKSLGPSTAPFVAGLGDAITRLREAERAAQALSLTAAGLSSVGLSLKVDTGTAALQLRQFQADAAENAVIQAKLELDVRTAADTLQAFKAAGSGTLEQQVRLEADVTRAQDALGAFLEDTQTRRATVRIDADVSRAQAVVDSFFAELVRRQESQATAKLGNIPLPDVNPLLAGFTKAQESVKDINDELTRAAAVGNTTFRKIKQAVDDTRSSAQKLADSLDGVSRAIGGLQSIGNQLGILDEKTNQFLDGIGEATHAVAQFASGDILGGIVSGLGAIASIGQGLFGKSADQKAAEAALHENTAAIRANTVRLSTGFTGLGGASSAADILRQVVASAAGQAIIPNTQEGGDTGRDARNALVEQLAAAGLGFKDLQRLADEFGITILERGKLVGGALEQLARQIDISIAAQLRFTQSFADQLQKQDLGSLLRGEPQDAAAKFAREIQAATDAGASAITDAFRGLGALGDTPAVQQALIDLFNQFANNTLDPTTLGTLSRDDFLKFLQDGANALAQLADRTLDAAKNLGDLNIPQGFKRAAIAFQTGDTGPDLAQLTARTAAVTAQFFPTSTTIKPLPDEAQALLDRIAQQTPPDLLAAVNRVGDLIAAARETATTTDVNTTAPAPLFSSAPRETRTTITFEGGIQVNISGEHKDPDRMANDFFAALRRKALTQSGDTLQFGVR